MAFPNGPGATPDPFDLQRFVSAQNEPAGKLNTYETALEELRSGKKRTHWMWFIFPQIEGLGHSSTSRRYAIKSAEEARQYLKHPVLRERLVACAEALLALEGRSAAGIFGSPDDMKLRSSMTLFAAVGQDAVFSQVLDKYFGAQPDTRTLALLNQHNAKRE